MSAHADRDGSEMKTPPADSSWAKTEPVTRGWDPEPRNEHGLRYADLERDIVIWGPGDSQEALSYATHAHTPDGLCIKYRHGPRCETEGVESRPQAIFTRPAVLGLNDLAARIHENARSKGFWDQERNFGEMLMLATSELAEAMEEHRSGNPKVYYDAETGKPEGVAVELVDCVIRCLDTLQSLDVDIDALVAEKMAYNATRIRMHGKAY